MGAQTRGEADSLDKGDQAGTRGYFPEESALTGPSEKWL